MEPLDLYQTCFDLKVSIPGEWINFQFLTTLFQFTSLFVNFTGIFPPLSSNNHCVQWNLFSNPDACVFIYNVLSKKHELNDEEDFLVLDREIRILRENDFTVSLGPSVLQPKGPFIVNENLNNNQFIVRLLHPSGPLDMTPLSIMERDEFVDLHRFSTRDGKFPYQPHQ